MSHHPVHDDRDTRYARTSSLFETTTLVPLSTTTCSRLFNVTRIVPVTIESTTVGLHALCPRCSASTGTAIWRLSKGDDIQRRQS